MYNDTLLFDDKPVDEETGFIEILADHEYLRYQREALGMTQKAVAEAADVDLRKYQRLEAGEKHMQGTSLRIGLAICDVLRLDPHRFVSPLPGELEPPKKVQS